AAGSLFRHDAVAAVTLAEPTGGTNGQLVEVQVYASGADRVLTVGGLGITIPAGGYWWGRYSYDSARTTWILDDTGGSAGVAASDATTSTKGVARLLGGTADNPTVPWSAVTGTPTIPAGSTVEDIQDASASLLTDGQHIG